MLFKTYLLNKNIYAREMAVLGFKYCLETQYFPMLFEKKWLKELP